MKLSRVLIIIVVIVVIGIVAFYVYETLLAPGPSGSPEWMVAPEYPLNVSGSYGVGGQQCVNSSSYIYCVGGADADNVPRDDVYSSNPLSSSFALTSWTTDPNVYPKDISSPSCVVFSSNIYCVGGIDDDNLDDSASTYYASLSSGVVGTWYPTTSYPIPVDTESCVASSGYIYCVAGNNQTSGLAVNATNSTSVWFAPLSSSGIGNWTITNEYPTGVLYPICYAALGYIYCLGGVLTNSNPANTIYYAALSATGVGSWMQTTTYPMAVSGQACVIVSSIIYCVGGQGNGDTYTNAVYYATVSSSGIGAWKSGATYTDSAVTDCVVIAGTMYCIGGFISNPPMVTGDVNYASLSGIVGATTTT